MPLIRKKEDVLKGAGDLHDSSDVPKSRWEMICTATEKPTEWQTVYATAVVSLYHTDDADSPTNVFDLSECTASIETGTDGIEYVALTDPFGNTFKLRSTERLNAAQGIHAISSISIDPASNKRVGSSKSQVASEGKVAIALYDFTGAGSDELSFKENDVITVLKQDSSGWCECRLNGKRGWAPSNYLLIK